MIIKIQLPLSSTEKDPPALLYNEDRSLLEHPRVAEVASIMRERPKAYFEAHIDDLCGVLIIDREVEEQPW